MAAPTQAPVLDLMNVGGDGTRVRLRWSPVTPAPTGYHIFTAATDAALTTAEGTTPLATVAAAAALTYKATTVKGTLAYFSVTAYATVGGDGPPSNHTHITPTADADSLTYSHILKAT